jgi:hypothetical protein
MTRDIYRACRLAMAVSRRIARCSRAQVVSLHATPAPAIVLDREPAGVVRSWCRVQGAPMAAGLYRGVRVSWPAGGAA